MKTQDGIAYEHRYINKNDNYSEKNNEYDVCLKLPSQKYIIILCISFLIFLPWFGILSNFGIPAIAKGFIMWSIKDNAPVEKKKAEMSTNTEGCPFEENKHLTTINGEMKLLLDEYRSIVAEQNAKIQMLEQNNRNCFNNQNINRENPNNINIGGEENNQRRNANININNDENNSRRNHNSNINDI